MAWAVFVNRGKEDLVDATPLHSFTHGFEVVDDFPYQAAGRHMMSSFLLDHPIDSPGLTQIYTGDHIIVGHHYQNRDNKAHVHCEFSMPIPHAIQHYRFACNNPRTQARMDVRDYDGVTQVLLRSGRLSSKQIQPHIAVMYLKTIDGQWGIDNFTHIVHDPLKPLPSQVKK